jgi:hypothetical protein
MKIGEREDNSLMKSLSRPREMVLVGSLSNSVMTKWTSGRGRQTRLRNI